MTSDERGELKLVTGRAHPTLAQAIAELLDNRLCQISIDTFANSEIKLHLLESVRGDDVFVIQSHVGNVNDAVMEQAIIIDALKRASARSITAVCPFMAYARQDRKASGREPISARLLIDILVQAGADRIMTIDLHAGQIQGFMNGPFDHLIARPILTEYIRNNFQISDLVIVAPDAGRVKSAERYSSSLGCGVAIVHKQRSTEQKNVVEARHLIGDVAGKVCILIDDLIDTAGTLCAAAQIVKQHGAEKIYGVATHGLFSANAQERIAHSPIEAIITTDTVPQAHAFKKVVVLSIAPILANAIRAVHTNDSISALFDGGNQQ